MPSIIFLLSLVSSQLADSWTYEDSGNNWTGLCATGTAQSPINIVEASVTTYNKDDSQYEEAKLNIKAVQGQFNLNDNNSYKLPDVDYGTIEVKGTVFNLVDAHFHSPSEHQIEGKQYDLALHLVGVSSSNQFLEFAVLYDEGDENDVLKTILESSNSQKTIDLKEIFEDEDLTDYYYYIGAVTAPQCPENTVWIIYGDIQEASAEQILFFQNLWENNNSFAGGRGNNKAIKPINGRVIYHYEDSALKIILSAILLLLF